MEDLISNLIEKLIIPHFGPLKYEVKSTKEFPRYDGRPGYVIQYEHLTSEVSKTLLIKETKLFLKMLGFKNVNFIHTKHDASVVGEM